ncbi:DJ-1/PfpI family protein [Paenibacillus aceris]|uniref:Transcriptional regulator GlxA family with amidase domain n=1 Tax=Paenibacillus aceris TaxID=869555 RepID=A0ABS4IBS0_9BACL|nr:DJ-1/PfpI family protein [Paenibacillus aceris]MBP1967509.1 transcriptional regulator GlxA family with amidase domain [Paenibacillus aceris]NHW35151.1 DJ-1/PfpI family protein [Paenibacillus aceris]
MDQARRVAILIFDNVEPMDFVGPFEVFIAASNRGKDFQVYTVAEHDRPVKAMGNLSVNPSYTLDNCPKPDIVIIPGGWGSRQEMHNEVITNWIYQVANEVELLLSVCTGALILAKANVLNGLKLTTNRLAVDELREVAPASAQIVEHARYLDNGKIVLSAGISAGIDMSLYVVGRLLGSERALRTAQLMEYDWKVTEIQ